MKTYLLLIILLLMPISLANSQIVFPVNGTIVIENMCSNWKAWRTVERNLWVGCGDAKPPAKSVELRAYYVKPNI